MKTDSLFYRLFKDWPQLALDFLQLPYGGESYEFVSEEIKQTGFRIDGLFKPKDLQSHYPLIFTEVQLQPDSQFYGRLFTEITLYLYQGKIQRPWLALVIYPNRSTEKPSGVAFEPFMSLRQLHRIYLEDYQQQSPVSQTQALIALIACSPTEAVIRAQSLVDPNLQPDDPILNFVETVLVYKLPHFTRQEIRAMLGLDTELKQTRFYQEIAEEERQAGIKEGMEKGIEKGMEKGLYLGNLKGEAAVLQRLLTKRFGPLSKTIQTRLDTATLEQLQRWTDRVLDAPSLVSIFEEH